LTRLDVEAIHLTNLHNRHGAGDRVAKHAVQTVDKAVLRLGGRRF
jgi:hypothetical protein